MKYRIKICGITSEADAIVAVDAGAEAVGLNFYDGSKRFVDEQRARRIVAKVPAPTEKVGVFVNHRADEIRQIVEHVGLDAIQLHGDEPATLLHELPGHVTIVRAFRCGQEGLAPLAEYLDECRSAGWLPDAVLIDADAGSAYGGSGRVAHWRRIVDERPMLGDVPLILAGGLTPENVAEAIAKVRPDGVDVASGVETQPGRKDAALVERFITAARAALSSR